MGGVNTRQAGYYEFSLCSLIAWRYRHSEKSIQGTEAAH